MRQFTITLFNAFGSDLASEVYSLVEGEDEAITVMDALRSFAGNSEIYIGDTIRIKDVD
jgi:hypothetical protein